MLWIFLWDDEIDQDSSEVAQSEADAVNLLKALLNTSRWLSDWLDRMA